MTEKQHLETQLWNIANTPWGKIGTDDSGDYWGAVNLCSFIYEEFKIENIALE